MSCQVFDRSYPMFGLFIDLMLKVQNKISHHPLFYQTEQNSLKCIFIGFKFSAMDARDPNYVPDGWIKTCRRTRVIFKTLPPHRIVIQNKRMLLDYQKQGRFLEANAEKLDFRNLCDEKVPEISEPSDEEADQMDISELGFKEVELGDQMELDDVENTDVLRKKPAEQEVGKFELGASRLEMDPKNPLIHAVELEKASEILSQVLAESSKLEVKIDVEGFKDELMNAETTDEFMEILKTKQELYEYFSVLIKARGLSEMLNLPHVASSPLVGWPTSVKENVYCEIVKMANIEAKEILSFLCSVLVPKDKPIGKEEVILVADVFSTIAHSVSKKQNALAKLKGIVLQSEGLSTAGLDRLSKLKGTECSTTLSRGRHLLVDLGEESFRSRVKQGKSYTITCDNLNLKQQNMTQSVIHMEDKNTRDLPNDPIDPQQLPKLFETENFLLNTANHHDLLQHFKTVVAVRVGKVLGENVNEAKKLLKFLPPAHKHSCSNKEKLPAEIFIPPPDYLNETDNAEFFEFCLKKQNEFLYAVAESVDDKEGFLLDLELVKCKKVIESGILESDPEVLAREAAERRVFEKVETFGRWVGYGDALTFKQFHLGAKALAQGNCTAFERLEYLSHFRLALFHAKMNKTYMDFPVIMPKRAMMEDEGSLPELVAMAGIQGISIDEKKIGNSYEKHDQLIMCLGHLYVANMFKNYVKVKLNALDQVVDEDSAIEFVLKMLDHFDVEFYYDPDRVELQEGKWDDPANYARDVVARMILSEVFDAGEEEEDASLLRCLRLTMMVYFLNRKYKIQDSKYAAFLLLDEVMEQKASVRDRERMNLSVCVNPSGKRGGGLFT